MTVISIESIQQARNENTPSETLARLATVEHQLIRQYVASNPNTPVEILEKLALEFPDRVMANPVLDLLILESVDSVTAIKIAIAESSNASEEILNRLKNHSDFFVRYSVARNPNTPKTISVYLKDDPIPLVRCGVARNPNTPKTILDHLKGDRETEVRYAVAQHLTHPHHIENSITIWGPPGIGKSSIIKQIAEEHNIFEDVPILQFAPTDLRSLPVADDGISR